ncbi:MAG: thioredoxin-disulfide reductase [Candidatus Saccharibacteria bacterium]
MAETNSYKLIIIGSGPSGLTAALYAARAGLKPLVIAGLTYGGQLMLTSEVENFPGFPDGIVGPELMQNMLKQAERFGAEIVFDDATKADFTAKPFRVWVADKEYSSEAIIIATGASTLWLGLPSEQQFRGKGVSSCATCDGFFFKEKEIAVVGGGDSAMEEAHYLTKFAKKITVLVRGDTLRASKIMQDRVLNDPKIAIKYNTTVAEFLGNERLTGIKLKDIKTGAEEVLNVEGAFVAIGHKPNTELFAGQIELDAKGYIVPNGTTTSLSGVFVAGDVRDYRYRQAVVAAGMGSMAALDAEKYLENNHS